MKKDTKYKFPRKEKKWLKKQRNKLIEETTQARISVKQSKIYSIEDLKKEFIN